MLGYYPNSKAKPRGSNLNEKIQTLVLWTFHKHLCGHTFIYTSIHTNKSKHPTNPHTHMPCLLTNIKIHILTHIYTHI